MPEPGRGPTFVQSPRGSLQQRWARVDQSCAMSNPTISTSSVRIGELRRQISAGEYTIDPIAIAEILLRRWRDAGRDPLIHTECP